MATPKAARRPLDKGLDEAAANGWTVVSKTDDWQTIFAAEKMNRIQPEQQTRNAR